jgi:serine phosphatase RsbU (regulator of sigma subunit)
VLYLLAYIVVLLQAVPPSSMDSVVQGDVALSLTEIEWVETEEKGLFEFLGEWQFLNDSSSSSSLKTVKTDSGWVPLKTAIFPQEINESWPVYGWFRATLPKGLVKDSVWLNTATVYLRGAADIYVNGVLWKNFGIPSLLADEEILARNFDYFPIELDSSATNEILVRFSNHKREVLSKVGIYTGFRLLFGNYNSFVSNRNVSGSNTSSITAYALIGFAAAFLILHLLIYVFNRKDKYNLAYVLLLATYISSYSLSIATGNQADVDHLYWLYIFEAIMVMAMHMALLFFVYEVVYKDIPLVGYVILGLGSLGIMKHLWFGGNLSWENSSYFPLSFDNALYLLTYIEIARSMFMARSKHKNARIIAIGGGFTLAIGMLNLFGQYTTQSIEWLNSAYPGMMALFISMSVYLATNLTDTNKSLAEKLSEVRILSQQNLAQERERSNLLVQNEKVHARAQIAELQTKAMEEENRRKSFELEEARKLQLSMLPQQLPQLKGFEICAKVFTATEVGGDYYDYHQKNGQDLLLTLGDATGHGVAAGTMVTATKALFQNCKPEESLDVVLRELSGALQSMNFKRMFMSLSLLRLHQDNFEYCAAGMPGLWQLNAEKKTITKMVSKGMALGTKVQFDYKVLTANLSKGDSLILLSDGYTELFNAKNQMMTESWLENKLMDVENWSATNLGASLEKIMQDWKGDAPLKDDASYLIVHKNA